ncbi:hypothetical protein ARMSODRAFT_1022138 [Armillaria solidipes]|uniref:F-box domain-containing protein n=1 Tax=Armillaria solidipes TaxID=1076256 RepID=A0A2H3BM99_9AGAR|nr:hypothetical protein ARMSODRAFT_1022138 [Armillaria solidipes]
MSSQVPVLPVEIIELILATLWSSSDLNVRERLLFMKSSLYVCQTWHFSFLRISLTDVHIVSTPYLVYILHLLDRVFTSDLAVRRVTLLCHNVSTHTHTSCLSFILPPNVEQLDMLFSYDTAEIPFDQDPCHRFYSEHHYYRPEFYSPDRLNDYESMFVMPYIHRLTIYGANPAMVRRTIMLLPALETLHTDIDLTVFEAGFDAANVRPTEGHMYEI